MAETSLTGPGFAKDTSTTQRQPSPPRSLLEGARDHPPIVLSRASPNPDTAFVRWASHSSKTCTVTFGSEDGEVRSGLTVPVSTKALKKEIKSDNALKLQVPPTPKLCRMEDQCMSPLDLNAPPSSYEGAGLMAEQFRSKDWARPQDGWTVHYSYTPPSSAAMVQELRGAKLKASIVRWRAERMAWAIIRFVAPRE